VGHASPHRARLDGVALLPAGPDESRPGAGARAGAAQFSGGRVAVTRFGAISQRAGHDPLGALSTRGPAAANFVVELRRGLEDRQQPLPVRRRPRRPLGENTTSRSRATRPTGLALPSAIRTATTSRLVAIGPSSLVHGGDRTIWANRRIGSLTCRSVYKQQEAETESGEQA